MKEQIAWQAILATGQRLKMESDMANIVIKDLKENVELDRKAMRQISGGKSGLHSSSPYRSSFFQNPLSFNALDQAPLNFSIK